MMAAAVALHWGACRMGIPAGTIARTGAQIVSLWVGPPEPAAAAAPQDTQEPIRLAPDSAISVRFGLQRLMKRKRTYLRLIPEAY